MGQYAEETDLLVIDQVVEAKSLVVHNDDVNTFDWVIKALIEICDHTEEQAEQCSIFVHTKGKYAVKSGGLQRLRPLRNAIIERGINATID